MKHFILKGAEADLVTVENVPIAKTGKFNLVVGGEQEFTLEDLEAAAAAQDDTSIPPIRQGVGHESDLNDGEPAMGTYENLRVKASGNGHTLYGDLHGVPRWFAKIMPSAYPNRSLEGERNYVSANGITHRLAITAVKCLGIVMPGISTLEDLRHMYGTEMPEGTKLLASYGDTKGKVIVADVTDDTIEQEEVRQVDPKALRTQLGLAETATDAEVDSTLAAFKAAAEEKKKAEDKAAEDKIAADAKEAEKAAKAAADAKAQKDALKNLPEGVTIIDTDVLEGLKVAAARANELHASKEAGEINTEVDKAIGEGKFAPARREHFVKACEADREGTFALMASMAAGLVPVTKEHGTSKEAGDLDEDERAYDPSMISSAQAARVAAAAAAPRNHLILVPGQILSDKVG